MIDSPLVIWLPLLPPSINHLYRPGPRRGQRVLSDEARAFRAYVVSEVALQARHEGWSVPDGDLWITIRLTFGSRARMDIDNRVKAALDAVGVYDWPEVAAFNDLYFADVAADQLSPLIDRCAARRGWPR